MQAALQYHVALEVNNSSLVKKDQRLNCCQNYRTMLALCQQYRVPIVVDSDAHDPSWVGRQDLACALLESVGFDLSLIHICSCSSPTTPPRSVRSITCATRTVCPRATT